MMLGEFCFFLRKKCLRHNMTRQYPPYPLKQFFPVEIGDNVDKFLKKRGTKRSLCFYIQLFMSFSLAYLSLKYYYT